METFLLKLIDFDCRYSFSQRNQLNRREYRATVSPSITPQYGIIAAHKFDRPTTVPGQGMDFEIAAHSAGQNVYHKPRRESAGIPPSACPNTVVARWLWWIRPDTVELGLACALRETGESGEDCEIDACGNA